MNPKITEQRGCKLRDSPLNTLKLLIGKMTFVKGDHDDVYSNSRFDWQEVAAELTSSPYTIVCNYISKSIITSRYARMGDHYAYLMMQD